MTKYNSDEIYKILESELVALQIKPGEILSENTLCARFDVSRTIVRSALQRLAQSGFVEIIPHVGTKVTSIDLNTVNQFIYLRIAVDSRVLRDFIRTMTPLQAEEIRHYKTALEQAVEEIGDPSAIDAEKTNLLLEKDLEFHRRYFLFMDKEILWNTITQPQPSYSRFIRLDMLGGRNIPDVLKEHNRIMDIIDRGDADAVDSIVSQHLYGGVRRLGSKIYSDEFQQYIKQ